MLTVRTYLFCLLLSVIILPKSAFSQDNERKILILGLDTTQFYSNAFYLDQIAKYNETESASVPALYGLVIQQQLVDYEYDSFEYISIPRSKADSIRINMEYRTMVDANGEEYLGAAPSNPDQELLFEVIESNNADYILSVNLYEILALSDSVKEGDDVLHVIHYDLFDKDMKNVKSGRFETETDEYAIYFLGWYYMDFALDHIFWIKSYEEDPEKLDETYEDQVEKFFNEGTDIYKKNAFSVLGGVGMPYGGLGVEYAYIFNRDWDWNLGLGYDFGGFKFGLGFKYYVLGTTGNRPRPFVGLNFGLATGNKFQLGGEEDENGVQLDPDDVSTYKIFSDQAIHMRFGLNIIVDKDVAISPTIGYSFPFSRKEPDLLSGPDKNGRNKFVQFMAVGGLEIGITITGYW